MTSTAVMSVLGRLLSSYPASSSSVMSMLRPQQARYFMRSSMAAVSTLSCRQTSRLISNNTRRMSMLTNRLAGSVTSSLAAMNTLSRRHTNYLGSSNTVAMSMLSDRLAVRGSTSSIVAMNTFSRRQSNYAISSHRAVKRMFTHWLPVSEESFLESVRSNSPVTCLQRQKRLFTWGSACRTGPVGNQAMIVRGFSSETDEKETMLIVQPRHRTEPDFQEALRLAETLTGGKNPHILLGSVRLPLFSAATYFGKGNVERIRKAVQMLGVSKVFINAKLTGIQERNLQTKIGVPVLDRVGLIIDIFAQRARSPEAKLQVKLAKLMHTFQRLRRGGPGGDNHTSLQLNAARCYGSGNAETAGNSAAYGGERGDEINRAKMNVKRNRHKVRQQLEIIKKTRSTERQNRLEAGLPLVAIVGYTNTGKSTLLTVLSRTEVYAEDKLFVTLDPTTRKVYLPSGRLAAVTDSVGFITDLPLRLITAFRATLEEVVAAEVIIHVIDASSVDVLLQRDTVLEVLASLGVSQEVLQKRTIEVWNKTDLVTQGHVDHLHDVICRGSAWVRAMRDLPAGISVQKLDEDEDSDDDSDLDLDLEAMEGLENDDDDDDGNDEEDDDAGNKASRAKDRRFKSRNLPRGGALYRQNSTSSFSSSSTTDFGASATHHENTEVGNDDEASRGHEKIDGARRAQARRLEDDKEEMSDLGASSRQWQDSNTYNPLDPDPEAAASASSPLYYDIAPSHDDSDNDVTTSIRDEESPDALEYTSSGITDSPHASDAEINAEHAPDSAPWQDVLWKGARPENAVLDMKLPPYEEQEMYVHCLIEHTQRASEAPVPAIATSLRLEIGLQELKEKLDEVVGAWMDAKERADVERRSSLVRKPGLPEDLPEDFDAFVRAMKKGKF